VQPQWTRVDEGWGRRAPDFAALSEPGNVREYVALHHALKVGSGDRVLDVACGAGLAVELSAVLGAVCAGLDASERLIAVARQRTPAADLRVGDMHALPWDDESFDVVTSFRGIWGTTPDAVGEVRRVLRPGGRVGLTVWGHIKASTGAWALQPFTLAAPDNVANQASMVALGRPGAGEDLMAGFGFEDVVRLEIPFAWEFADPAHYARALASTGPAFEAIQAVGEEEFVARAEALAASRVQEGLPLRAEIAVVGYTARKPVRSASTGSSSTSNSGLDRSGSFLSPTPPSTGADRLYAEDLDDVGYVMNVSRLWGRMPDTIDGLFDLLSQSVRMGRLTVRQRGVLVTAAASTLGDAYCSLAWGGKLAKATDPHLAAAVLRGDDGPLDRSEQALAQWARKVVHDPNATTAADVQALRDAGFDDGQVFAVTLFIALRVAFSTVNDALGANPDADLFDSLPPAVRNAVTFGRPVEER
jgi:SAM-dependent methyltransferase/alkylhydroperoxidase family enzyme